jgi:two-component system sensor histidine kinase KdpD
MLKEKGADGAMLQRFELWYDRILAYVAKETAPSRDPFYRAVFSGMAALGGIAVMSLLIGVLSAISHVSNISLLYLVPVIVLAILFGRRAAIAGAVFAFLAYDFFFIPPLHQFTVDNPSEWVSLSALLLTGLVVGQLTAEVRHREQVAIASEQRTALLYALAQAIAAETDHERLPHMLMQRSVTMFESAGVMAAMLWLPNEEHRLTLRATAHTVAHALHPLDMPSYQEQVEAAFREGHSTTAAGPAEAHFTAFVPLVSSGHVVGIFGIQGTPAIADLLTQVHVPSATLAPAETPTHRTAQAYVFAACCDQYALALERAALQQEAIHDSALRESNRLKTALLDSVTHDLRTPIAAIQAAASSLQQKDVVWSSGERDELLTMITTSSTRLARLVDNLLMLSRLEVGTASVLKQWYPINDVIATALDQLDAAGITTGFVVDVSISDDPLEAPMEHTQIERVMTNLVENAAKYSPPGSHITIKAWRDNDALSVSVTDHGIGIPPAYLEAIFDKFYRLQRPLPWARVSPPQGTGLGLAICASIVREHGGRIWAESPTGHGATFTCTLPLVAAAPSSDSILPALAGNQA